MIFCVENDANIRDLVIYTLTTTEMEAKGFEDGMEILKKLKISSKTREIPVIMQNIEKEKIVIGVANFGRAVFLHNYGIFME